MPTIVMQCSILKIHFDAALPYDQYVRTGTDEQARRFTQVYDARVLTDDQSRFVGTFTRQMNVLIVSGIWCGDCIQQIPLMQRIAEANPEHISLKLLDRDEHKELSQQLRINGGNRVPVVLFLSEDFELCGIYADRTLSRYRAIAQKQLGASCETGILAPAVDELAPVLQDWLDEFERIQLMLRLSPRLRQKHGD